jgi:hypothetical protein
MEKGQDYRRLARECLRIAEAASSSKDKAMLVTMAEIWHRMAEDRERGEVRTLATDDR